MQIKAFSKKQRQVFGWWQKGNPHHHRDAIICDGAIRSGKTFCLSLSFLLWGMITFQNQQFALCGKTIGSLYRNLVFPLVEHAKALGLDCQLIRSKNLLVVGYQGRENHFHLFGGKDEGSFQLIQGITLAGILFDEVVLMPQSFVQQGLARCSVEGARFWFNCNPDHPGHWFYKEWIAQPDKKNACYLHFTMEDNPSLSLAVRRRYESLYTGTFYKRYVKGEWIQTQGCIYPMFSYQQHVIEELPDCQRFVLSCDYGTTNPTSFGLWGYEEAKDRWIRLREYYHCSRTTGQIKTDEEYADDLIRFLGDISVETVVVDPSAASFIQTLRRRGAFSVTPANNHVLDGIRLVASLLGQKKLLFHKDCSQTLREFGLYRWQPDAPKDKPLEKDDHTMDDLRYFAQYAYGVKVQPSFYALSTQRHRKEDVIERKT